MAKSIAYASLTRSLRDSYAYLTRLLRVSQVQRMRDSYRGQEAGRLAFMIQEKLLDAAEVICATCLTAGSDMLSKRDFGCVLLDEATQSTEIATLVPIVDRCDEIEVGERRRFKRLLMHLGRASLLSDRAGGRVIGNVYEQIIKR